MIIYEIEEIGIIKHILYLLTFFKSHLNFVSYYFNDFKNVIINKDSVLDHADAEARFVDVVYRPYLLMYFKVYNCQLSTDQS